MNIKELKFMIYLMGLLFAFFITVGVFTRYTILIVGGIAYGFLFNSYLILLCKEHLRRIIKNGFKEISEREQRSNKRNSKKPKKSR